MAEGMNVEAAHKLSHAQHHTPEPKRRWEAAIEIVEVLFLAVIAIVTAWSGYQAAQWDGQQGLKYGVASRERFEADAASTAGGQQLVADSAGFTAWLQAEDAGNKRLQTILVRRFTPDYRSAFAAWLKTDPLNNPSAPAGPAYMPGFKNPNLEQAKNLNEQASVSFEQGTAARETAEKYVRATVFFASVLFLVAIAQRFKIHRVRVGANALACAMLIYACISVATLPRL
jgi:hypothetical protein